MLLYMSQVNVMPDKEGTRKTIHICVIMANSFDMIRSFFLNGYSSEKSDPAHSSASSTSDPRSELGYDLIIFNK